LLLRSSGFELEGAEPAALSFGGAPEDPVLLAVPESLLEALWLDRTISADRLGPLEGLVLAPGREEDLGVCASAEGLEVPREVEGVVEEVGRWEVCSGGGHFLSRDGDGPRRGKWPTPPTKRVAV
jgi:hypothetical protein